MATVKVYKNGISFGIPGHGGARETTRGTIQGWSRATARRQQKWLYSVDIDQLGGHGYAVTLTLRDCPDTAAEFEAARRAVIERWRRLPGFQRLHWVIEWQRRGVPHLHIAVYFENRLPAAGYELLQRWVAVCEARQWHALIQAQDVKPIAGAVGWLRYLSKHAARSAAHYQRVGMPPGWESTGRLWGKSGDWPTEPPAEATISRRHMHQYRRYMRRYALAQARKSKDWRRVAWLRRAPARLTDPYLSSICGMSEWVPEDTALSLLLASEPPIPVPPFIKKLTRPPDTTSPVGTHPHSEHIHR